MFNPDFPLDPSSSRRRGSSKKNTPRSGQNLDFDLLCREFLINWIPACAGMTKFRANGKSRFNTFNFLFIFAAIFLTACSSDPYRGLYEGIKNQNESKKTPQEREMNPTPGYDAYKKERETKSGN
jgi:hypothetical protein